MHAIFYEIVSQNTHFVTFVISFSLVLAVSVSETVCSLILTILHPLKLLANNSYTIELTSIPAMGLLSSITDHNMTKRTLIEMANAYPQILIIVRLSGIPETAGLGLWCMFKFQHMQFQFGCQLTNCL